MITIKTLPQFDAWLDGLPDRITIKRLKRRLEKVANGNFGDIKPVSGGVYEMREHFGAGWRMYYTQRGSVVIVMLGGGDKASQAQDITQAIDLEKTIGD